MAEPRKHGEAVKNKKNCVFRSADLIFAFKMESVELRMPLFELPGSCCISGASFSGKSTILYKIIQNKKVLFTQNPEVVIYCYHHHPGNELDGVDNLILHMGLPEAEILDTWVQTYGNKPWLLCFDDMQNEFNSSDISRTLMTRLVHHSNLYVICVSHKLFTNDRHSRINSLNFHSFLLTRNCRDLSTFSHFSQQILGPGHSSKFLSIYLDATALKPSHVGYLYVYLHPLYASRNSNMLWTNILPGEEPMILYKV